MKKLLLCMLMGMTVLGAMAQRGKFTVKGTFEHVGDSVHFFFPVEDDGGLFKFNRNQNEVRAVTGEMIEVTFDLRNATEMTIGPWFEGRKNHEEGDFTFPAIPGETLIVTTDQDGNLCLGGSQFYVDYNEARKRVDPINQAADAFVKGLKKRAAAGESRESLSAEARKVLPTFVDSLYVAVTEYIKEHPDQDAAAALIAELPEDVEFLEPAVALLTERARGSVAANLYSKKLKKAQYEAAEYAKRFALQGETAPDFTLKDINGKPLALSSLRGKWVILDFWGSWCGWCIKGMPKMKEYYAKYNGKFEIVGLDCFDTDEKWKDAVKENELPWIHVYFDKDDKNSDNPIEDYNVQGFPTKVVIDPEGQVTKIIVGEDPAFYDYLDEVLK